MSISAQYQTTLHALSTISKAQVKLVMEYTPLASMSAVPTTLKKYNTIQVLIGNPFHPVSKEPPKPRSCTTKKDKVNRHMEHKQFLLHITQDHDLEIYCRWQGLNPGHMPNSTFRQPPPVGLQ